MNFFAQQYRKQWLRLVLALLIGASGTLAFSPFDLWPFALVALTGLQLLLLNRHSGQAAAIGFAWGIGLFGSGINWIYVSIANYGGMSTVVNVGLVLLLAAWLALFPMLFAAVLARLWPGCNTSRLLLAAPAIWQCTEWLRGWLLTGFPWLQFGYSQIDGPLQGLAPLAGVASITFVLLFIAGLLCLAIYQRNIRPVGWAGLILLVCWPLQHLHWFKPQPERATEVALVQGNIPQSIKWSELQLVRSLNTYEHLTAPYIGKAKLIIWPESAIADLESSQQPLLRQLDNYLRTQHTALATGIIESNQKFDGIYDYNSVITLGNSSPYYPENPNRYRKHHLVPFGEYVPFASVLRPLAPFFNLPMSGLSAGSSQQEPLNLNGYQLSTAICYEIILGDLVRKNWRPTTDFLLTVSNDAWFGHSIGPWQHLQMARMRALELGRPLLRATNNGVTAIVNPDGKISAQLPQFQAAVLSAKVTPTKGITPYARFGYWIIWLLTLIGLTLALLSSLANKKNQ